MRVKKRSWYLVDQRRREILREVSSWKEGWEMKEREECGEEVKVVEGRFVGKTYRWNLEGEWKEWV